MKKAFRKLHLWLSIPFGLVISITCFSGAALVFETEIMELCYPERYRVEEVGKKALPLEQLLSGVSQSLPDSVSVTGVNIPSDPARAYQVALSKPRRASVYVNQYTGEVKGSYERAPFFAFMIRLHRWLLDGMRPQGGLSLGKLVVGISTLFFVFVLITGIIVWIPATKKALKSRLSISVRKGGRRFWYDMHVAGGFYVGVLLLALALTGLTWSFSWYRTGFYKVFGVEVQQENHARAPHGQQPDRQGRGGEEARNRSPHESPAEEGRERSLHGQSAGRSERGERPGNESARDNQIREASPATAFVRWQQVYEELNRLNPRNKQISLSDGSAAVSFAGMGNQRASDRYTIDRHTGAILSAQPYRQQEKAAKMRGWIYSIHVGSWGGLLTKILTFLAALVGGTLPLTGYYFWLKRVSRKENRKLYVTPR